LRKDCGGSGNAVPHDVASGASTDSGTVTLGGTAYHLIPKSLEMKQEDYTELEEVTLRKGTADGMLCVQTSYDKLLGKFGNPMSSSLTEERLQKTLFAECETGDTLNLQTFLLRRIPGGGFVLHPKYYTDEQDMCLKSGDTGSPVEVGRCSDPYQNDDKWKIADGRIVPVASSANVR